MRIYNISSHSLWLFIILMSSNIQDEAARQNIKLLRKTFKLPEQSILESLKRRLDTAVKQGANLFLSLFHKKQKENLDETRDDIDNCNEQQKQHLRFSFHDMAALDNEQNYGEVEAKNGKCNDHNKLLVDFNEDLDKSKLQQDEQSFEQGFRKGKKKQKKDTSDSSLDRLPLKALSKVSKEDNCFYQAINFSIFAEMQKNIAEAKKKSSFRSTEDSSSKCEDYVKYAMKISTLSTSSESKPQQNQEMSKSELAKRQKRSLRKKVLFEDQGHQLYDLNKVIQSLNAEKARREEERRIVAENKRKEQERRQMMERLEMQRKMEAQMREQEQKRRQEQLRKVQEEKAAAERLLKEQQKKQQQEAKQKQQNDIQAAQKQDLSRSQSLQASPFNQNNEVTTPPVLNTINKNSEEGNLPEKQPQFDTPVKPLTTVQESTPQKQSEISRTNNPFCQPTSKVLTIQDLINNQKSNEKAPSFFTNGINPIGSPPRAASIFSNPQPVNNLFTVQPSQNNTQMQVGQSMGLQPTQLQTPNSFSHHFMNNNNSIGTPNSNIGFNPNPQNSFFGNQMPNPPSFGNNMNLGINNMNNNMNININNNMNNMSNNSNPMNTMNFSQSSSSPSQPINMLTSFPSMPLRPEGKNLFMNTVQPTTSLFGSLSGPSASQKSTPASRNKKNQIRVS